jgi:ATP-dependent Lon protease
MIIPIYDLLLLPGMEYPLTIKHIDKESLQDLIDNNEQFVALPLKHQVKGTPTTDDFYKIGVILKPTKIKEGSHGLKVAVEVTSFAEVTNVVRNAQGLTGDVMLIYDDVDMDHPSRSEMLDYIKGLSDEIGQLVKMQNTEDILKSIHEYQDLNRLMGFISQFMQLKTSEKYRLMEITSLKERSLQFIEYHHRFHETMKIQMEMAEHFNERANKNYREQALREQLRLIQAELNGDKDDKDSKKDYATRIEEADLPEEVKAVALEELDKFESQNPQSSDYNVIRNYLDFILDLPWHVDEEDEISIQEARRVLNEHHYGLDKVKDRIIQHLAVMQLKKDKKGSIVLLVGPPGTGKTSLGKSIATAMNREYVRISLGGVRDEAQIRGHRRTYVGALPGRILKAMKDAGTMNPVMVLDEIDKLMAGYSGDPASALLEVLDPEQNHTFTDHYLDMPYDLSNVMFITTANSIDTIPRPLLDRMEVIQISSYTATEKFHIAEDHLVKKSLDEHGLTDEDFEITEGALAKIISDFTMEAGVRGLKKQLDKLSRVTAEKVVSGEGERPFKINADDLDELLGRKVSRHEKAQKNNPPGVVTGLAWTPVGGEILFIEATDIPGKGGITLTGKLGDVMQESARIALSLLKSRLPVNAVSFKDKDIHIHVPSGAVPKDGPSAGIALFTSLASLVTGIPLDGQIAMTGEVSLRGAVMPIGGLKEKLIAAQRAGITKALIPIDNEVDLKDVPEEVKNTLEIVPVETIEDVLRETLHIQLPKINTVSWLNQDDKGGFFLPS